MVSLDDKIMKPLKEVDKVRIVGRALHTPVLARKAWEESQKIAEEFLKNNPYQVKNADGDFENLSVEKFRAMDERAREEITANLMQYIPTVAMEKAILEFNQLVEKDSIYMDKDKLAALVKEADVHAGVRKALAKEDKGGEKGLVDLVDDYRQYASLKTISGRMKDGKPLSQEEEENLRKVAGNGVAKRKMDEMLKLGYTREVAQAGAKITALIYDGRTDKMKMVEVGAGVLMKELKKKMEKVDKSPTERIAGEVRKYFAKEIKSSDIIADEHGNTMPASHRVIGHLYRGENDNKYGLATREYEEVCKKK